MKMLLRVEIGFEQDVVLARRRARQLAEYFGFEAQDQVRIATAVSEVARNALQHAGGGMCEFFVETLPSRELCVRVSDQGPGISSVQEILDGEVTAGNGLIAARRVMDRFSLNSSKSGTTVLLTKALSRRAPIFDVTRMAALSAGLANATPQDMYQEFQSQNQELLRTLVELRKHQAELSEVNRELEETNRGVVALYSELEGQAASLKRLNEQKFRFYSSMSHEFRTPINSIMSLARMLLNQLDGPLNAEQTTQVKLILKSAQNLHDWVNDLLDLAKAEAGKFHVQPSEFEVNDLLVQLRGVMRPLLTKATVELNVELSQQDLVAYTDEGKVTQILRNLVSNAIKFTEGGTINVSVGMDENDHLRFLAEDTGIGIAPEFQGHIFDEFVQLDSALQRNARGTGLGLPLSKRLAELLGGTLTLTSEAGVGSKFTLLVPRIYHGTRSTDGEAQSTAPSEENGVATAGAFERQLVLVIDDDEAVRYLLHVELSNYGFDVAEAANGKQGLALARSMQPKLIILDIKMPELDGFEVLQALASESPTRDIPIILHTSTTIVPEERERLREIVDCFIQKESTASGPALREALEKVGLIGALAPGDPE